jgi:hypothetical protein
MIAAGGAARAVRADDPTLDPVLGDSDYEPWTGIG